MTAPRPAGDGEWWCLNCDTMPDPNPEYVHPAAECPWRPEPDSLRARLIAAEQRATDAEARIARVRSMRAVATDGKVTVAAIDWALDGHRG